ncbi:hypothetical protein BDU57DRAFT_510933 [Ampelomyces quisqualis]|uniref:NAD(P)-binding protein n=1 Tax=Ampelomyces quisqualis TaxID=50730 RepID=A0A6A5R7P1_AMPQU|nr:hypothetical protein BDU57DRAFT_510933 [Ampelomyces quisqualis]
MALFTPTIEALTILKHTPNTFLITGSSSGIGLSTATLLSSLNQSHNLIMLDRNPPPPAFQHPSSNVHFHTCDITSWQSQRAGFAAGHAKFGRIDCVFVNAGMAEHGEQFFNEDVDNKGRLKEPDRRVLNVDLNAASDTVKFAIYYLKKNGSDGGEIVVTASLAGYLASAGAPLYSAAKHGLAAHQKQAEPGVRTSPPHTRVQDLICPC